jgi:hypothetical protein
MSDPGIRTNPEATDPRTPGRITQSPPESAKKPLLFWAVIATIMLLGLYVRREALWVGFVADDYAQLGMLDGTYPVARAPYNLFSFSDGSASEGFRLIQAGFYPWWADPQVRLIMVRPLASLMIALDHRLFGNDAFLFHLHSVVWWFVMLGTIASFFRRMLPLAEALVAFALLAADEAHGMALAWLCNRSAFVAIAFSVAALHRYVVHRRAGRAGLPLSAMALYTIGLGFGEYAICLVPYLLAFEFCEGDGAFKQRFRKVLPMLAPAVAFLCLRAALGATVRRSGVYVDPIGEPIDFFKAVVIRVPVLIGDLALALQSEYWTFGLPWTFARAGAGVIPPRWIHDPEPWRAIQFGIGLGATVLLLLVARYTLRRAPSPNVRWLFYGSILSLVPVCASYPSSRLLLTALLGFTPLVAAFVVKGVRALRTELRAHPIRSTALGIAALGIAGYQLLVPIMWQRLGLAAMLDGTLRVRNAIMSMEVNEAEFPKQDLVLLTALEGGTSMYLPLTRLRYGRTAPHSCLFLSYLIAPYELERVSTNAFTIRFGGTAAMLATASEQLLRSPHHPFQQGDTVDVGRWHLTVLGVLEGKPQYLRIDFDRRLEDPSLIFMALTPDGYRRVGLPEIGEKMVILPAAVPNIAPNPPAGHSS